MHHAEDAVKCVLAGPGYLAESIAETARWVEANEWSSLSEMRGYMDLARCPDPASYERVNYSLILQGAPE